MPEFSGQPCVLRERVTRVFGNAPEISVIAVLADTLVALVRLFPKLPPLEQNGCGPSTLISPA